ncbi:alpha/beta hydrolase [Streptomyces alkaliterrae]|uniref:alpha/beta hydrolase n=1 Tax=Streptomyces alkaliterrae TaxID=2213162 RepID=UPI002B200C49|nr:alpha/beta hydrolase [Streptomyces alkaliterrae]
MTSARNVGRSKPARALGAATLAAAVLATPLLTAPASAAPVTAEAVTAAGAAQAAAAKNRFREPDVAKLAGKLAKQELDWEACRFPSVAPATEERLLKVKGVACATVKVPLDWHNVRNGKTIDVRISRTQTSKADKRQGIALVNPGGPGGSGLPWGAAMAERAPKLAESYDFIGFDPRGVGLSTPLKCTYEVPEDPTDVDAVNRAKVRGCVEGGLAPYITTEQTAYDMDLIRVLFGERKTSYIGYSYGTWLGTWYAATFPSRSHRFLLDSATDVTTGSLQLTWDLQPRSRDRQFQEALLPYVARNDAEYGLGTDPMKIREYFERAGGTREFIGQLYMAQLILPAMYDTTKYPSAAAAVTAVAKSGIPTAGSETDRVEELARRIIEAGDLDKHQREFVRDAKAAVLDELRSVRKQQAATAGQTATFDATFEAIRCQDGQWSQNMNYWQWWLKDQQRKAPLMSPFNRVPLCAYWPTANRMPKPHTRTFPKVMVLQSELDAATAYEGGLTSAKKLPGAALVSVDNEGSHGLFPYGTTCVDDPVETYFLTGKQPRKKFTGCQALPLPAEDTTHEVGGSLGKHGKIKIKMMTDKVKEANRLTRDLLRETNTASGTEFMPAP